MTELEQALATLEAAAVEYAIAKLRNGTTPPPVTPPPVDPPVTPPATGKPSLWDSRLDGMATTVERRNGKYELIAAWITESGNWDNVPSWAKQWQQDTLGGDHHVFGRVEREDGSVIDGESFFLVWPYPSFTQGDSRQAEPDGWANLPLGGQNWNPADGRGPYDWFVGGGDKISAGMPLNHHVSIFAVWRER